ncbi:hypothetical protein OROMI_021869 [Orobanche minor]
MITSKIDDEEYLQDQARGYYLKQPLYGRRSAVIVNPDLHEQDSLNLSLMPPFDGHVEFVSSCNGIVCVRDLNNKQDIYLFNPLTRRIFKKLPPPICESWQFPLCFDVVFGFDCLSNDFKILKIGYEAITIPDYKHMDVHAVHLYSYNADSWRVIEVDIELPSLLSYPICSVLRSGPVVDGVLYLESMDVIVTFDLHNESFGLIKYPSFLQRRKSGLFDFEGSVAVVVESVRDGSLDEKEVSLWTVEAVSDEVFWNKMFAFGAGSDSETIDWVFLYCGAHKFVTKTKLGAALYDYHKKTTKYVSLPSSSFLVRVLKHTERFLSVD